MVASRCSWQWCCHRHAARVQSCTQAGGGGGGGGHRPRRLVRLASGVLLHLLLFCFLSLFHALVVGCPLSHLRALFSLVLNASRNLFLPRNCSHPSPGHRCKRRITFPFPCPSLSLSICTHAMHLGSLFATRRDSPSGGVHLKVTVDSARLEMHAIPLPSAGSIPERAMRCGETFQWFSRTPKYAHLPPPPFHCLAPAFVLQSRSSPIVKFYYGFADH